MAKTQGHGNPDWTRDEVILALDLYFDCEGRIPSASDARVLALSQTLRALPIHREVAKNDRFRNPDGVVFKIGNLRSVATGSGLGNVAATDRQVWASLGSNQVMVKELAGRIRAQISAPEVDVFEVGGLSADEEFAEGRIYTAIHKKRERSPVLRKRLLSARRHHGALSCEACLQPAPLIEPGLEDAVFEAHHTKPLAEAEDGRTTKVSELALLCAGCHRLVHRLMHVRGRWVGLEEVRRLLMASRPT